MNSELERMWKEAIVTCRNSGDGTRLIDSGYD